MSLIKKRFWLWLCFLVFAAAFFSFHYFGRMTVQTLKVLTPAGCIVELNSIRYGAGPSGMLTVDVLIEVGGRRVLIKREPVVIDDSDVQRLSGRVSVFRLDLKKRSVYLEMRNGSEDVKTTLIPYNPWYDPINEVNRAEQPKHGEGQRAKVD